MGAHPWSRAAGYHDRNSDHPRPDLRLVPHAKNPEVGKQIGLFCVITGLGLGLAAAFVVGGCLTYQFFSWLL